MITASNIYIQYGDRILLDRVNLVIGGQLADGADATNLLSYMCLRAQADLGLTQPNLSIRIHQNSPAEFLEAAAFVISRGSGMPQVFNDEVIIPGQLNRGISPADAMNYAVVGCVELSTPGKALGWSDASMFNLTRVLELTLFGGRDPRLVQVDDYHLDANPMGTVLILRNRDVPGVIGQVGTILAAYNVNIGEWRMGRFTPGGDALSFINLDATPPSQVLDALEKVPAITQVKLLNL